MSGGRTAITYEFDQEADGSSDFPEKALVQHQSELSAKRRSLFY